MRIAIDKCPCGCGQRMFRIDSRPFHLRAFYDYDEWFLYLRLGRRWWRWSTAGNMTWHEEE